MEFKNSIYVAELLRVKDSFGDFHYENRNPEKKLGFHNLKVMVVPNFLFGKLFNITVEYYNVSEKEVVRGVPAAGNGWHVHPVWGFVYDKHPYWARTYTPKEFNLVFKDTIFKELD